MQTFAYQFAMIKEGIKGLPFRLASAHKNSVPLHCAIETQNSSSCDLPRRYIVAKSITGLLSKDRNTLFWLLNNLGWLANGKNKSLPDVSN